MVRLPGGGIRVFAPAKINLYLEILGLRPDGYHEIDTVMQEVSLEDEIEIRAGPPAGPGSPQILLEVVDEDGRPFELGPPGENLVFRAAQLLLASLDPGRPRPGLTIRLRKRIPLGAGLGGGSSDAAAALAALADLLETGLEARDLLPLAARLGSDVAFFIEGGMARCRGRGEIITALPGFSEESPLHCVLAYPGFQASTSLIYKELDRQSPGRPALTRDGPLDSMSPRSLPGAFLGGDLFFNRLEPIACRVFPELESYKKEIQREPFVATLLSGSGSTFYGTTRSRPEAEAIASRLRGRIPGKIFVVQSGRRTPQPGGGFAPSS
jgi:4-diphosphocytidyl-2-C-methyl-D-erythritol kinase